MQKTWGAINAWRFSGDPDFRETALGVAESAVRARRCMGDCHSIRDHAGVLYCLTSAYDETRNPKFLQAAREVVEDASRHIDPRRGAYIEVHGSVEYKGNVPWMAAQLIESLYLYYRQSGDIEAATLLVGLAESVLTENTTRGVPGDVYGYSHNPKFDKSLGYNVLIAPAVLYAYELTDDPFYLEHARAMYATILKTGNINSIRNVFWNSPTLLYMLRLYGPSSQGERGR